MFPKVALKATGIVLSLCMVLLSPTFLLAAEGVALSANPQTGEFTPVKAFKADQAPAQAQASQDPQAEQKNDTLAVAPSTNPDGSSADPEDALLPDELFSCISDLLKEGNASEQAEKTKDLEQVAEYLYGEENREIEQALLYSDWENSEIPPFAEEDTDSGSVYPDVSSYEESAKVFENSLDDIREDLNKGISLNSLMQQIEAFLSWEEDQNKDLPAAKTEELLTGPESAVADEEIFFSEDESDAEEEISYAEAKDRMALDILGDGTVAGESGIEEEGKTISREIDETVERQETIGTVSPSVSLNAVSKASTQTVLAPLMTASSVSSNMAMMDSVVYKPQNTYQPQYSNLLDFDPLKSQRQESLLAARSLATFNSPFMSRSLFDPSIYSLQRESFLNLTPLVGEEKVPVLYRSSVHLRRWYSFMTKRAIGVDRNRQSARYTYRFGTDSI